MGRCGRGFHFPGPGLQRDRASSGTRTISGTISNCYRAWSLSSQPAQAPPLPRRPSSARSRPHPVPGRLQGPRDAARPRLRTAVLHHWHRRARRHRVRDSPSAIELLMAIWPFMRRRLSCSWSNCMRCSVASSCNEPVRFCTPLPSCRKTALMLQLCRTLRDTYNIATARRRTNATPPSLLVAALPPHAAPAGNPSTHFLPAC